MAKLLATLFLFLLIGFAIFYINRDSNVNHEYFPAGSLTKDKTPASIRVGKSRLNIPKNYIFDKSAENDGVYTYLLLIASFPNMIAYSDETENYYKQRGDVPLVHITMLDGEKNQFKYDSFVDLKSEVEDEFTQSPHSNYYVYEYDLNKENGWLKKDDQLIVSNWSEPYQLNCTKQDVVPSPHCFAFIRYSDELLIKYSFNRKYLYEWPGMEENITKLIDTFVL